MTPATETVIVPRRELDTTAALVRLIECAVAIAARGGRRTGFDATDLDAAYRLSRSALMREVEGRRDPGPVIRRPFRSRRAAVGGVL
ncbi:hypothetical protein Gdia_2492 [Gluconacetobacter diazotrophicus PA1 5]|uniref:hypothetical protein n=1 Tax=Gluconacetobacter diazotrophicus TaxID=33996 RepID=UPI000173D951|nr:hypothetical protein [Gluconacetobacter diazotrophicus]ACI52236.1 hypothetical protein Gdia_2492 [Gluconacetobacter diazotrophicus PA1 5]